MSLTVQQQDRFRDVAQGVRDLLVGGFQFVRIMIGCMVVVAVALLVGGLLTADPDTTTFRDFLLTIQSTEVHRMVIGIGCIIGLPVWMYSLISMANRARSARYPMAAAAMGRAQTAPKKEGGG